MATMSTERSTTVLPTDMGCTTAGLARVSVARNQRIQLSYVAASAVEVPTGCVRSPMTLPT